MILYFLLYLLHFYVSINIINYYYAELAFNICMCVYINIIIIFYNVYVSPSIAIMRFLSMLTHAVLYSIV